MSVQWVAVLSHLDRSGVIATFGPHPSEAAALAAVEELKTYPMEPGVFDVVRCFPLPLNPAPGVLR